MAKKIRLIDEDATETTTEDSSVVIDGIDPEAFMKYIEAIDWKLWELLKLARKHMGEE